MKIDEHNSKYKHRIIHSIDRNREARHGKWYNLLYGIHIYKNRE